MTLAQLSNAMPEATKVCGAVRVANVNADLRPIGPAVLHLGATSQYVRMNIQFLLQQAGEELIVGKSIPRPPGTVKVPPHRTDPGN